MAQIKELSKIMGEGGRLSNANVKRIAGMLRGPKPTKVEKLPFKPKKGPPKMKTLPLPRGKGIKPPVMKPMAGKKKK